jgi:hypothetical protein
MARARVLFAVLMLAGCSSAGSQSAEPVSWAAGRYELRGSVNTVSGGISRAEELDADLVISSDGQMSMFSSTGVCQDPDASARGADTARGRRTFVCGSARYEIQPAGNTVRGRLFTTVTQENRVTVCIRYVTTPQGERVCAETQERIELVQVPVSAQLVVHPR